MIDVCGVWVVVIGGFDGLLVEGYCFINVDLNLLVVEYVGLLWVGNVVYDILGGGYICELYLCGESVSVYLLLINFEFFLLFVFDECSNLG